MILRLERTRGTCTIRGRFPRERGSDLPASSIVFKGRVECAGVRDSITAPYRKNIRQDRGPGDKATSELKARPSSQLTSQITLEIYLRSETTPGVHDSPWEHEARVFPGNEQSLYNFGPFLPMTTSPSWGLTHRDPRDRPRIRHFFFSL